MGAQLMIKIIKETRDNVPSDILGNIWTQVISYRTKQREILPYKL